MVGLKKKDITKDVLLIFVLSYEYGLNFTNVLKLFRISKKYFWTFMEICNPMLKMGTRKAMNIRKSVENILPYAQAFSSETSDLTPREEKMLQVFNWFVQDSFSDGEGCLHISQLPSIPFVRGYRKDNSYMTSNAKVLERNLDEVEYVTLGDTKFSKTSRMMYYLEKYAGDINMKELDSMSVLDMVRKINDGMDSYVN